MDVAYVILWVRANVQDHVQPHRAADQMSGWTWKMELSGARITSPVMLSCDEDEQAGKNINTVP